MVKRSNYWNGAIKPHSSTLFATPSATPQPTLRLIDSSPTLARPWARYPQDARPNMPLWLLSTLFGTRLSSFQSPHSQKSCHICLLGS